MPKDLTEPAPLPKARPPEVANTSAELPGARRRLINTARPVFWLLFAINTVNFLDRFLAVAVAPTLKSEFHLTDANIGALSSAYILIYTLAALPLGLLADRASRAFVISIGVSLWSVASGLTGVAMGLPTLFITRAGVGIGEASYYPAGTALLSAYYSLERRARVLSRWGSSQLVGVALAFAISAGLSALLGPTIGWRVAFLITAVPGFLLAAAMWFVAEQPPAAPVETSSYAEEVNEELPSRHERLLPAFKLISAGGLRSSLAQYKEQLEPRLLAAARDLRVVLRDVARIRTIWVVAALQALTFLIITPSVTFLPIYLRSSNGPFHLGETVTDGLAGAVIIVGGLGGQLLGGNVADWLGRRVRGGRILTATVGFGLAVPAYAVMLLTHSLVLFVLFGVIAVLLLNLPVGPILACAQDVTPAALRATAIALTLLVGHLLGDVWSPVAVGAVSTALGEHIATSLLIFGVPALLCAAVVGFFGVRIYVSEVSSDGGSLEVEASAAPEE
jgi:MFS transporter, Spinster family, sphingosine-1-phosphate transporter